MTVRQPLAGPPQISFEEYHDDLDGFSVSSGGQVPYDVVYIADDMDLRTTRLRDYTALLREAGYRVDVDPEDHLWSWMCGHLATVRPRHR